MFSVHKFLLFGFLETNFKANRKIFNSTSLRIRVMSSEFVLLILLLQRTVVRKTTRRRFLFPLCDTTKIKDDAMNNSGLWIKKLQGDKRKKKSIARHQHVSLTASLWRRLFVRSPFYRLERDILKIQKSWNEEEKLYYEAYQSFILILFFDCSGDFHSTTVEQLKALSGWKTENGFDWISIIHHKTKAATERFQLLMASFRNEVTNCDNDNGRMVFKNTWNSRLTVIVCHKFFMLNLNLIASEFLRNWQKFLILLIAIKI